MKRLPILFPAVLSLLMACNSKPKNSVTVTSKDGKETASIDPEKAKDGLAELQKTKDELEKLTPLTKDELTAVMPAELMGAQRSDVNVESSMGTAVANASYQVNDSAKLQLEVVDCAGAAGAGLFGMQYMGMINMNSDDEDEYVKTIDLNGAKAFENCKKKKSRCTIAYFSGNRFLVSLRGDNIGVDALKELAGRLKIK